jgi:hypothetical protein
MPRCSRQGVVEAAGSAEKAAAAADLLRLMTPVCKVRSGELLRARVRWWGGGVVAAVWGVGLAQELHRRCSL